MEDKQLSDDLAAVVAKIQKSKREDVRAQITRLQKAIGSADDLFADGRALMWQEGGAARAAVSARQRPSTQQLDAYKITWRGGGYVTCTASRAAEMAKRSVTGLAISVGRLGRLVVMDGDEVITISKL